MRHIIGYAKAGLSHASTGTDALILSGQLSKTRR